MEEKIKANEQQTTEKVETKETTPNLDVGTDSKTADQIKDLQERTQIIETENRRLKLGGGSEGGAQPEKPKKDTDDEFLEKLEKGEIDL